MQVRPTPPRAKDLRNERTLRRYLDRERSRLAFFAFASYLAHGRGAVAFQLGNRRCHYETYEGVAVPLDLQAALAGYNPEQQLLLHFQDAATTKAPSAAAVLVSESKSDLWPVTIYYRMRGKGVER